jgi:hypothetical protein
MRAPSLPFRLLLLVALLAALLACAGGGRSEAEPEQAAEASSAHMEEHLVRATDIQAAVIRGDLDDLREHARWMSEHLDTSELPEEWRVHAGDMQTAAELAYRAPDVEAAAEATGAMGRACGACHEAAAVVINFGRPSEPVAEGGSTGHMCGHQWAAERLWEGLIGPSHEAWEKGSQAMVGAALPPEELSGDDELYGQLQVLEQRVHDLGVEGVRAQGSTSRAELYGEFLSTCSQCHALTGALEG